ncbi:MAG: pilus assembly protein [Mesorhizobium amorphae]|nr:MAG: pilus assembly protein [Mesorhizobium amorphae]
MRRWLLAPFLRDRSGATGVEFAMLALPFAFVTFAILESCISFAGSQVLANATENLAREIRTGRLKAADITESGLKTRLCEDIEIMVVSKNCEDSMIVDLREFPTFEEAAKVRVRITSTGEIDETGIDVKPGMSQSKNMLRVFYRWPVLTDFLRASMSNLKDGTSLHFATVTWQNEPFDD